MIPNRFTPAGPASYQSFVSVNLPSPVAMALAGARALRQIEHSDLGTVCAEMQGPAIVACPLISGDTDALSVIGTLQGAGFQGTLLVVAPPLPDPRMVERELRDAASGLSLRLLSV